MDDGSTARVVAALEERVGRAPAGARLPPTRVLVAEHGVSPVTVQKALRVLVGRGLVETRPGVGTFVCRPRATAPADLGWQTGALGARGDLPAGPPAGLRTTPPEVIPLHVGYPDPALLPERLVRGALARAARGAAAVTRPAPAGSPDLRAWFAAELGSACGPGVAPPTADDVTILAGSQSGLSALFRAVVGAGRPLVVESPTYWGALRAARHAGVRLVPVASGPHGPDPAGVDRALEESGARVVYAQPGFANPTGACWTTERGDAVLEVVRRRGAFLVEDDWAHDLGIEQEVVPLAGRDTDGHVVHLRSLTKSLSPAVRVAALTARGPVVQRVRDDQAAESMYVSGLLQAAALDVVTQPGWATHRRRLRQELGARRDRLLAALREHAPAVALDAVPRGGLNLWARLPGRSDVAALVRACEADGLAVADGAEWYPAEPEGPRLRLGYAAADPARFETAARILGHHLA